MDVNGLHIRAWQKPNASHILASNRAFSSKNLLRYSNEKPENRKVDTGKDKFLLETQKKIIKAYLPSIILTRLKEATITSATDIISIIKNRYNIRISPGTIYPILYKLERNGRIRRLPNRIKKIYVLTEKGKEIIEHFQESTNYLNGLPENNL